MPICTCAQDNFSDELVLPIPKDNSAMNFLFSSEMISLRQFSKEFLCPEAYFSDELFSPSNEVIIELSTVLPGGQFSNEIFSQGTIH